MGVGVDESIDQGQGDFPGLDPGQAGGIGVEQLVEGAALEQFERVEGLLAGGVQVEVTGADDVRMVQATGQGEFAV
ncbi:hypothetical protein D9M70_613940 [compost metagenome]